jgi:hypothetical protein
MSNAEIHDSDRPRGASLLPRDLTDEDLAAAPVLASADALLIEDLTADEDDAFFTALTS